MMYYITFDNDNNNDINFTLEKWNALSFDKIVHIIFENKNLNEHPNLDTLINLIYLNCSNNQLTVLPNLDKLLNLLYKYYFFLIHL